MYSIKELQNIYDKQFGNGTNFHEHPPTLYEPVLHIMDMKGKKIRPMLLLMSADMFGCDIATAMNPAFAVEVFHNFTLVHDDIMDEANLRRGMPTVHKKFGLNAGVLAGDVMLAFAYEYLSKVPENKFATIFRVFNKMAIEIFEGQQMDIDFEKRHDVNMKEYIKMIEWKTSVLIAASMQIGALLGDANIETQNKMYDFGLHLGLSFQIKDDWLDTFGNAKKVGKKIGGDILQNKKTWLLVKALNIADKTQSTEIATLLKEQNEDKKINGILEIYRQLDIKNLALQEMENQYKKAMQSFHNISIPSERKANLLQLSKTVQYRDS